MSTSDDEVQVIRDVHLPLEKMEECVECGKTTSLRLCSSCRERVYCSPECQKADWIIHKAQCGKTDKIDLLTFYPLLACMAEAPRNHPDKPVHQAIVHQIINSPNPGVGSVGFPDGSWAKLVLLGDEYPIEKVGQPEWWPSAQSISVRQKLFRRFVCEGFTLPIVTSVCVALLAEMYTTTFVPASQSPDGQPQRRVRLQYKKSPIADFGIVKGSVDVKTQDTFAYFNVNDMTFTKGEDPNDHYWIYFTDITGEEYIFECNMYTFNFCMVVDAAPYVKYGLPPFDAVPAFLLDRHLKRNAPSLHRERKRFSVLRNKQLHAAIRDSHDGMNSAQSKLLCDFVEKIAEREFSWKERALVVEFAMNNCIILGLNLRNRSWESFPAQPPLLIDQDPGEMDDMPPEEDEAWWKYMKKWNRKQRRGEITSEQLGEAFRAWTDHYRFKIPPHEKKT